MASFVSALPAYDPSSSAYDQPASTPSQSQQQAQKPTALQQMEQMQEQGQSATQIADQMGLPLTLVQSELGETATTLPVAAISFKA